MQPLPLSRIREIARLHGIKYEILKPGSRKVVATRLSRTFNASQEAMFDIVADLRGHEDLFNHCKKAVVVDKNGLENVLEDNQFIVVSDVAERGSKLAISRYTLERPTRVVEDLMTDPFPAKNVRDRKDGKISWVFRKAGGKRCTMICQGEFEIQTGKVFVRGLIDHVWLDFFEMMMIRLGELRPEDKLTLRD